MFLQDLKTFVSCNINRFALCFFYKSFCYVLFLLKPSYWSIEVLKSFFNRVADEETQTQSFPVEFMKCLKTEVYERLLLKLVSPGVSFLWLKSVHGLCIKIYSFACQFSFLCYNQKQSSSGVLRKRCSHEFCKIHKKRPALEPRF